MRIRLAYLALLAATVGLAASGASLIDTIIAAPTFCAASGCETVRASAWAHPLGIPMPALGIVFFASMLGLGVVARPRLRLFAALAGGAWAIALVAIQAYVIEAWCKLCLVADVSAIVHAIAVAAGATTLRPRRVLVAIPVAAAAVLGLHFIAPPAVPELPDGTPECVLREQRPGVVTVVDFVDFECPFCRKLAPELDAAIAETGPVHLVRKMLPLTIHHGALPAALAWCCADAQGKGEAMAQALFAADPAQLTTDGCEQIAATVGVDLDRYRKDRADRGMRQRILADVTDATHAGINSLPTVFIGGHLVQGASLDRDDLAELIRDSRD
jgi:uncharacterized membrane protein/protein-disulfide isomerase